MKNSPQTFEAQRRFGASNPVAKNTSVIREIRARKFKMRKYEKTFIDMRAELSGTEAEPIVFDPDNQAQLYLQAMADEHIFNIKSYPTKQLNNLHTPEEVLKIAMVLERDSIAFYTGLKESVSRKAGKDKVEAIIKEEINHSAILSQKMQTLK